MNILKINELHILNSWVVWYELQLNKVITKKNDQASIRFCYYVYFLSVNKIDMSQKNIGQNKQKKATICLGWTLATSGHTYHTMDP